MTEKTLTYDELHINISDIYAQMGYGDTMPSQDVVKAVADMTNEIRTWLKARFVFCTAYGTADMANCMKLSAV